MDPLLKYVELAPKFAWPVLTVAALVLFIPDDLAKALGIYGIRKEHQGYIWLGLFISAAHVVVSSAPAITRALWRFIFCPIMKLLAPQRDRKLGIAQSRMRYHFVRISALNDHAIDVYQEVSSNGLIVRYLLSSGEPFALPPVHDASMINGGTFEQPEWVHIDWSDIFSGDISSGCWAISQP